jgi:GTP pyrophosphokinase
VFRAPAEKRSATGILIEGLGNLMTRPAKCCNPAPPDVIVAYVTRDRGITIHRKDCAFALQLTRDRLLSAQWSS